MRLPPLIVGGALLLAVLLYTRRAQAAIAPAVPPGLPLPWETGRLDPWPSDDTGTGLEPWPSDDTGTGDWTTIEQPPPEEIEPEIGGGFDSFTGGVSPIMFPGGPTQRLIDGLLFAIRTAEVGNVPDDERYFYGYGYKRFSDVSDHPVITGELAPVRLPDRFCAAVGLSPGCVSTAAGAYQIIRPTWNRLRAAGRWGPRLPDFSPASQDEAARRLLRESGIVPFLERGDIRGAITRAGTQWASLPGSTAKQGGITMDRALALVAQGAQIGPTTTV